MDTRSQNHEAFTKIIPIYQEVVSTGGGLSTAIQLETGKFNSAIVEPCPSDFISDVDISARRVLNSDELGYFNQFYKSGQLLLSDPNYEHSGHDVNLENFLLLFKEDHRAELAAIDNSIREKLGAELIRVGIYPLAKYLAPVDTRGLVAR